MYPNEFRNKPRQDISSPINSRPIQRPPQNQPHPSHQHENISEEEVLNNPKKKSKTAKGLLSLLLLVLIGGAAYGGYFYANYEDKNNTSASSSTPSSTSESESSTAPGNIEADSNIDPTHFVLSTGLPFDLNGKKKFLLSLGLPENVQAVTVKSDNSNRGYEKFYTDKYNDEMGRWEIGYPKLEQSYKSQVSIVAISKSWINLTQSGNRAFNDTGVKIDTPEQKKAYIEKIRKQSNECVKDAAKGFSTQDSSFNVCFSVIPGVDSYTPILVLQGYGLYEDTPMLFVGSIRIDDGKIYDKKTSVTLLADAKEGKLPQSTVDLISEFANSLSKTTLKVEDN